jgi:hypothetical protein
MPSTNTASATEEQKSQSNRPVHLVLELAAMSADTLVIACKKSSFSVIKNLLENGCPVSAKALDIACEYSSFAIIKLLLENGCSMSAETLVIARTRNKPIEKLLIIYKFRSLVHRVIYNKKLTEQLSTYPKEIISIITRYV